VVFACRDAAAGKQSSSQKDEAKDYRRVRWIAVIASEAKQSMSKELIYISDRHSG
jgi:hypothetical protein